MSELIWLKWVIITFASFLAGIGWNGFWKTIDYSIREWVKENGAIGFFIETIVDLMHHTKPAAILFAIGYLLYPRMIGAIIMSFSLGIIFIDSPREKERLLSLLRVIVSAKPKEEITEVIEEVAEPLASEVEKAREVLEEVLSGTESRETSEGDSGGAGNTD